MKLSKWAKQQNIHYNTAYRWFKQGRIPNAQQLDTGTIIVNEDIEIEKQFKLINEKLDMIIREINKNG